MYNRQFGGWFVKWWRYAENVRQEKGGRKKEGKERRVSQHWFCCLNEAVGNGVRVKDWKGEREALGSGKHNYTPNEQPPENVSPRDCFQSGQEASWLVLRLLSPSHTKSTPHIHIQPRILSLKKKHTYPTDTTPHTGTQINSRKTQKADINTWTVQALQAEWNNGIV